MFHILDNHLDFRLCGSCVKASGLSPFVVTGVWDFKLRSFDFHIFVFIYLELIFVYG